MKRASERASDIACARPIQAWAVNPTGRGSDSYKCNLRVVEPSPGGTYGLLSESVRCCGPLARRRVGNADKYTGHRVPNSAGERHTLRLELPTTPDLVVGEGAAPSGDPEQSHTSTVTRASRVCERVHRKRPSSSTGPSREQPSVKKPRAEQRKTWAPTGKVSVVTRTTSQLCGVERPRPGRKWGSALRQNTDQV